MLNLSQYDYFSLDSSDFIVSLYKKFGLDELFNLIIIDDKNKKAEIFGCINLTYLIDKEIEIDGDFFAKKYTEFVETNKVSLEGTKSEGTLEGTKSEGTKSSETQINIDPEKLKKIKLVLYYNYFFLDKNQNLVSNLDLLDIITEYKPPNHLSPLFIINQKKNDADFNLVYFGIDKNNKTQYIYGKLYVEARNKKRVEIFLLVDKNMEKINKFIKNNFPTKKNKITNDNLMSVLLLLEFKTFMRTGKIKFFKENQTSGILTLLTKNVKFDKKKVIINFIGKKQQQQQFIINDKLIYKGLSLIFNEKNFFLFTNSDGEPLNESYLYKKMQEFNVTLKNIRTYGVNILLLRNIYDNIDNSDKLNITKKKIHEAIKNVANYIGHTVNISKKSYISDEIIDYISTNLTNHKTFDSFFNTMVDYLKKKYLA